MNEMTRKQSGLISIFVLISMILLLIIINYICITIGNETREQESEINKIKEEYEADNINQIYEETKERIYPNIIQ